MKSEEILLKTAIPGPKSRALLARRLQVVAQGVSYGTEIFVEKASGAVITDVDGNRLLDFTAGIGVSNQGHGDTVVIQAIKEQAEKYLHCSINVTMYEPYIALCEKLAEITPGNFPKKVMLANSGAEAVENAVKIARKYTGKSQILSLEMAFHGRTYMAMTLTSKVKPYKDGYSPFCPETLKIPSPYHYRSGSSLNEEDYGRYLAQQFEQKLQGELSADHIAAIIMEPIQGEGGFIPLPDSYLQEMQRVCRKNHILLILDEIQAGFSRTGHFFCSEYSGIEPDLMTISKALAGGMPVSAVVGRKEIMDAPGPGGIGGTFCGNPVACAAALAVIKRHQELDLPARASRIGFQLKERLERLQKRFSRIGDVRGRGAMMAIELVVDSESKAPDKDLVKHICSYSLQKGVIFMSAGLLGNCIRFLPPLIMNENQIDYAMNVLENALEAYQPEK